MIDLDTTLRFNHIRIRNLSVFPLVHVTVTMMDLFRPNHYFGKSSPSSIQRYDTGPRKFILNWIREDNMDFSGYASTYEKSDQKLKENALTRNTGSQPYKN
jgi:hypothetical protein